MKKNNGLPAIISLTTVDSILIYIKYIKYTPIQVFNYYKNIICGSTSFGSCSIPNMIYVFPVILYGVILISNKLRCIKHDK